MAIKKSELYSSLWKSCDQLRGGMDASQYKDYILILLFVKYVSDKYEGKNDPPIVIPKNGSFQDMRNAKGNKDIGHLLNEIIRNLAFANDLGGVITVADFSDTTKLGQGRAMQERLTNLVAIFENPDLDFSKNRAGGDDILGDAYEYLMRHFAKDSGKSKGQFYTPAEVSRVIAKIIGMNQAKSQEETIYDPTCGSGSLLLKAADEAPHGISIFGQEMDNSTFALAHMNMILHGHPSRDIQQGNTLSDPYFKETTGSLKTFDFAVANPPFSSKAWTSGVEVKNDLYERFTGYGTPPEKNGDYAFLLHLIRSLNSKGKGAIILPHGVLFRGNAEGEIRKNIILKGFIKGIIGLPANLFFGTGIPACIIVIDKENAGVRKGVFMIDASRGFMKDGDKNRLRDQDIHKIVDVFNKQTEIPKYSRMVPGDEIERNGYNLNIPRYIDSQEPEDIHDIEAHLLGGIPAQDIENLSDYWNVFPTLKRALFTETQRKGYMKLRIPQEEIKRVIYSSHEFTRYTREVEGVIDTWKRKHTVHLKGIGVDVKPKELIHELSEDILRVFERVKLIDKYDIYQYLMVYWTETMQDDVYMISVDGWKAELTLSKKKKDDWDSDLVPKVLVINRYFETERKEVEGLEAERDGVIREREEMDEEYGGEEGILEEVKSETGKISKGSVQERIKEIAGDKGASDELKILQLYLQLIEKEVEYNKRIKDARVALDRKVIERYRDFTEEEIKELVVDDKWMGVIGQDVRSEMDRLSQRLTSRVKELAERYEAPLSEISREVEELTGKVEGQLKRMGFHGF